MIKIIYRRTTPERVAVRSLLSCYSFAFAAHSCSGSKELLQQAGQAGELHASGQHDACTQTSYPFFLSLRALSSFLPLSLRKVKNLCTLISSPYASICYSGCTFTCSSSHFISGLLTLSSPPSRLWPTEVTLSPVPCIYWGEGQKYPTPQRLILSQPPWSFWPFPHQTAFSPSHY